MTPKQHKQLTTLITIVSCGALLILGGYGIYALGIVMSTYGDTMQALVYLSTYLGAGIMIFTIGMIAIAVLRNQQRMISIMKGEEDEELEALMTELSGANEGSFDMTEMETTLSQKLEETE